MATRHRPLALLRSRRSSVRLTVAVLGCALLMTACGGDDAPSGEGPTPPPGAADASLVSLDALPDAVAAAIADAAERFGVPESEVAVAGALRVTWADGSLGCPEPDTMYTQALVPGYLLTLEVEGRRVEYHGAEGEPPFLCER
jgi:hypothetical protein